MPSVPPGPSIRYSNPLLAVLISNLIEMKLTACKGLGNAVAMTLETVAFQLEVTGDPAGLQLCRIVRAGRQGLAASAVQEKLGMAAPIAVGAWFPSVA